MNAEVQAAPQQRSPVYVDMDLASQLATAVYNHTPQTKLPWTPSCALATLAFAAGMVLGQVGFDNDMSQPASEMPQFMEMGRIHVGAGVWGRA